MLVLPHIGLEISFQTPLRVRRTSLQVWSPINKQRRIRESGMKSSERRTFLLYLRFKAESEQLNGVCFSKLPTQCPSHAQLRNSDNFLLEFVMERLHRGRLSLVRCVIPLFPQIKTLFRRGIPKCNTVRLTPITLTLSDSHPSA